MGKKIAAIDGNEATASVAHRVSEVIAIYPITPSSNMAEHADQWSAQGRTNIWGDVPRVVEMQSEGGAAGAVHGALQAGALTTTFTASQGLLLMIPNMYKIAGELTPAVFHVSARSLAAQALSIFGDHSDVMAIRQTGFAMLASSSVQEAHDMAAIAHSATLEARIPFIHFFDGFRTSHEVMKIELLSDDQLREMIDDRLVESHRRRALSPDHPVIRGTAQNPDVYFQGRETVNPFYSATPRIVQKFMDRFKEITGREYKIVEYFGDPEAEKVIVINGSGFQTALATAQFLQKQGQKVGVLHVRLYRPFPSAQLLELLPRTVKKIAVLDRTKEPGAIGEPLYLDIVSALTEAMMNGEWEPSAFPTIVGGRYGLSSKEFTPAMVKAIYDELGKTKPKNHFTVGIVDDVTMTSLDYPPEFSILGQETFQGLFFGLGADGTVGANKNSIKIIAENTENYAQGYFVYDSKKSGSMTISHLRFGPKSFQSPYLIDKAKFIACHHTPFLASIDMLSQAREGAIFLVNTPETPDKAWDSFPRKVQEAIIRKKIEVYVVDGYKVGRESGMGRRINTIMQTCFFSISGILPKDEAIAKIKDAIRKTYSSKGDSIVQQNFKAVDMALEGLHRLEIPAEATAAEAAFSGLPEDAPEFVRNVTGKLLEGKGDDLPVSAIPVDGTYPTATAKWEKRNLALEIPVWEEELCTQCGKCSLVCPHAVIRMKIFDHGLLADAPETFKSTKAAGASWGPDAKFSLQVAPEDCTGCAICVEACPAHDKENPEFRAINMRPQPPIRETEKENWNYFLRLPEVDRSQLKVHTIKGSQLLQPLFEFSGACTGCGETPYVKLVSQLFGDRSLVANATGCSSIYGGNLPTTPWCANDEGRGPAWANSLFEDNAEFGLGFRLAVNKHRDQALGLIARLKSDLPEELVTRLISQDQSEEAGIAQQRRNVEELKNTLKNSTSPQAKLLSSISDYLVQKSVWILGGDGWAYDIGFGGLDHVIASGENVNILVLDTEVYSNTGGQMSKATPRAAVAQFAAAGKPSAKKDLALMAMTYGNVYVARIAMGANDTQAIKALVEAERYPGPSVVIAFGPCIAHGYDLQQSLSHQKLAVDSGYWPLMRYNPLLALKGKNPLQLDSKEPKIPVIEYIYTENRFRQLYKSDKEKADMLAQQMQVEIDSRWKHYELLAKSGSPN